MKLYQSSLSDFKELYYANAALGIIASSCLGSVAAMLILMCGIDFFEMVQLFFIVSVAMWYNATVLAQMKPKFVFNSLLISVLASIFAIVYHLILIFI
ncbi:MAG: hypothetical protein CVU03_03210 [Bacteroidetes bacterium HGW-Bacteroidetes-2]|jgi:hypothetical protein|nr:MAG: hypothetical protein CVU03_03210 [Bacteroidetes bacterium HGW-Bacteroidetes-2]